MQEEPQSLRTAKQLASGRYYGWTYGSKASSKKIDCSQFMLAVVEEMRGDQLSKESARQLVVGGINRTESLGQLILQHDARIKGVVSALVSMGMGTEIDPSGVAPGDFIQYWYKSKGRWAGHTAIVESVRQKDGAVQCRLFGSHKSLNRIGTSSYWVSVSRADYVVFVARVGK